MTFHELTDYYIYSSKLENFHILTKDFSSFLLCQYVNANFGSICFEAGNKEALKIDDFPFISKSMEVDLDQKYFEIEYETGKRFHYSSQESLRNDICKESETLDRWVNSRLFLTIDEDFMMFDKEVGIILKII